MIFWTFHVAEIRSKKEVFTLFFMFTQEACLTMEIGLDWPQVLQDIWGWMSTVFNLQVSFAGPECFGEWGYEDRWTMNAFLPVIVLLLHSLVFLIRWATAKANADPPLTVEEAKGRVKYALSGSLAFWYKMLFMTMIALCVKVWVCEQPTFTSAPRLVVDPSITCDGEDGSPWPGLVFGSIVLFLIFAVAFPIGSFVAVWKGGKQRHEEWFQMMLGILYMAFDDDHWWWHVGPVTVRRILLQIFSLSIKRSPAAQAGLGIAIHAIYGLCVVWRRPYSDPVEEIADQGSSEWDALDMLAVIQSVIQVIILILGLAANPSNADTIAVMVLLLYVSYALACIVVYALIKERTKRAKRAKESAKEGGFDSIEGGPGGEDFIQCGNVVSGLFDCCACCCKDSRVTSAERRLQQDGNNDVEMSENRLSTKA
jgi:hypothetical protein